MHRAAGVALLLALFFLSAATTYARDLRVSGYDEASSGNFHVLAVVTDDPNWEKKWQGKSPPKFRAIDTIKGGKEARILVFFYGAQAVKGKLRVKCDLALIRKEGTQRFPSGPCYTGVAADGVHLASLDLLFGAHVGDPSHIIEFAIGLTDQNSGVRVPVRLGVHFNPENPS